jgi:hypothetical protein
MQRLDVGELESQTVLQLPDRQLLGAFISISGHVEVSILENLLNNSFRDWHITVLNDNSVSITVQDNLTQTELNVFCAESAAVLSAQCSGTLT